MSISNVAEAFYVLQFIVKSFNSGLVRECLINKHESQVTEMETSKIVVGVVSYYKAQERLIQLLLEAYEKKNEGFNTTGWLKVTSAEQFQGLEASWILITGCRGGPDDELGRTSSSLGFLGQWDRINVGITRGRLGVVAFMRTCVYRANRFWNEFIEQAEKNNGISKLSLG